MGSCVIRQVAEGGAAREESGHQRRVLSQDFQFFIHIYYFILYFILIWDIEYIHINFFDYSGPLSTQTKLLNN